jgi:hypothetical protein
MTQRFQHSRRSPAVLGRSAAPRRAGTGGVGFTRRALLALGAAGVVGLVAVPLSAQADEYPSWQDVLDARGDVTKI